MFSRACIHIQPYICTVFVRRDVLEYFSNILKLVHTKSEVLELMLSQLVIDQTVHFGAVVFVLFADVFSVVMNNCEEVCA